MAKSPQGDTKSLIAKLQAIEAFPNKETSVKPIQLCEGERKSCTTCKFKGHLSQDCWGKCKHCGSYEHQSHLCRNKKLEEDTETAKKTSEGNKKGKGKGKKKKGKKEEAKRVAELIETLRLDSPANSSDEETSEDSDASPQISQVRRIQDQNPSSRRVARAMEFVDSISDQKVIQTLDRSHLASKVKRAKTAQGQSHTEDQVSNSTSFRNAKDETFLLDSGAGVKIIGKNIAIDNNIKV